LGAARIPIHNITTSEIKISCIVPREEGQRALQAIHDAFDLERLDAGRAEPAVAATGTAGA
jgi:aspartate kinase